MFQSGILMFATELTMTKKLIRKLAFSMISSTFFKFEIMLQLK